MKQIDVFLKHTSSHKTPTSSHCTCKRSSASPTGFMSCSFLRSRRKDLSDRCRPQTRRIPRQSSERTTDKPPRRRAPHRSRRGNLTEPLDGTKPRWDTLSEHAEQSADCRQHWCVIECLRGRFHHSSSQGRFHYMSKVIGSEPNQVKIELWRIQIWCVYTPYVFTHVYIYYYSIL